MTITIGESPSPSPSASPAVFEIPEPEPAESGVFTRPFPIRLAGSQKLSGDVRMQRAQKRMDAMVEKHGDAAPAVTVDQSLGVTVIRIAGEPLLTIIPEDLPEYGNQLSPENRRRLEHDVAAVWAKALDSHFKWHALQRREEYRENVWKVCLFLFFLAIAAHLLVHKVARRYLHTPAWSVKAFIWSLWLVVTFVLYPEFGTASHFLGNVVVKPLLNLIAVFVVGAAAHRIGKFAVRKYFAALRTNPRASRGERAETRNRTMEEAAQFLLSLAVFLLSLMLYAYWMGITMTHIAATTGLVGAALSIVFKETLMDYVSGINILHEDQFGVGDFIESGGISGTVEGFNLRATRIRGSSGELTTVGNRELQRVANHSNEWSQVDFRVTVPSDEDEEKCARIIMEEAQELARQWSDRIVAAPVLLGVEDVGAGGVTLRALVRTKPLAQWEVRRELNRRVKARFDREGVSLSQGWTLILPGAEEKPSAEGDIAPEEAPHGKGAPGRE